MLVASVFEKDFLIARVRGDNPEERGRPDGVREHLVHVGVLEKVQPAATVFVGKMRRPESRLLDLGLDLLAQVSRVLDILFAEVIAPEEPEAVFVGKDFAVDDLGGQETDLIDPVGDIGDRLNVHRHDKAFLGCLDWDFLCPEIDHSLVRLSPERGWQCSYAPSGGLEWNEIP